ncbi:MAG: hypothetical protein JF606_15185 [Burkholderiales bacterium]|nr:hypothetical protein [Burkholderiales bacterium]
MALDAAWNEGASALLHVAHHCTGIRKTIARFLGRDAVNHPVLYLHQRKSSMKVKQVQPRRHLAIRHLLAAMAMLIAAAGAWVISTNERAAGLDLTRIDMTGMSALCKRMWVFAIIVNNGAIMVTRNSWTELAI